MNVITNTNIKAKQVRLIDGTNNTVLSISQALSIAQERGLDLVQINGDNVPVVKVLDAGKYIYDLKIAEKEQRKKQRSSASQKEIQVQYGIQEHDFQVKVRNAQKFITSGKSIKVVFSVPNRQSQNVSIMASCKELLEKFIKDINLEIDFVQNIQIQGKNVTCVIKQK